MHGTAPTVEPETQHTLGRDQDRSPDRAHGLHSRIEFLYKIIEDTQATVRFLDTKAAFCVTLLSGMAAVTLEHQKSRPTFHVALFALFMVVEVCSVLVCLRVIFPTVKPHIDAATPSKPPFYVGHNKAHHWILHTIANPGDNILSESKNTYLDSLEHATDEHLLSSLCDTVLTLAFIRQIKNDRIHAALFCLIASVVLFGVNMLAG